MQRTKEKLLQVAPIFVLLCFSFGWLWLNRDVYFDPKLLLPRDNLKHHFPMFLYVRNYIRLFGEFPNWLYSYNGGLWLPALTNNFLVLMPHRLLGVWASSLSSLPPSFVYKCFLLVGQGIFCWGLYRLSGFLFSSRWIRAGAVGVSLVTAVTLTFTYQEHALATLFFIPWLWIGVLKLRESSQGLPLFATLLGLSLNHHYPQLIFIYGLVVLIAAFATLSEMRKGLAAIYFNLKGAPWKTWGLSVMAFVISAAPLFYSYAKYKDKLESPFRLQKGGIESVSYDQYLIINTALSKLHPSNLNLYFNFEEGRRVLQTSLDESLTFMGPLVGFILFGLIFLKVPFKRFHLFVLLSLAVLACGTYTFAPRILWYLVPGITLFRQWIFFLAFLDLHLLLLLFVVVEAFSRWKPVAKKDKTVLLGGSVFFLCMYAMKYMGAWYTLPAIFFCLLKLTEGQAKRSLVRTGLYTWVVFGTLQGAGVFMKNLRALLNDWRAMPFAPVGTRSDYELFGDLKLTYRSFVALPKGADQNFFYEANSKGHFFYANEERRLLPVTPETVSLVPGGIKIRVSQPFPYLMVPQLNDGVWKITGKEGASLAVSSNYSGEPIWAAIPPGTEAIEFRRGRSLWNWLIVFMWVPLFICLGGKSLQKMSSLLSRGASAFSSNTLKYKRPISRSSEVST